jgi:hypothetical protein
MRPLYIIGLVLSVIHLFIVFGLSSMTSNALSRSSTVGVGMDYYYAESSRISVLGGIINLIFIGFVIFIASLTIAKMKSKTMKVMSIITISLSGIFFLYNLVMLFSPGSYGFNEGDGASQIVLDLFLVAFYIVGLVHVFKKNYLKTNIISDTV